jgi:4-alpha-glucanotransferase
VQYRANDGRRLRASDECLLAVLIALGAAVDDVTGAPEALAEWKATCARRTMEPVVAHRRGVPTTITVSLPSATSPSALEATFVCEDGDERRGPLSQIGPGISRPVDRHGKRTEHRIRLDLDALPLGHHRLVLAGPGVAAETSIINAPSRCPRPARSWGASLPVHALRGEADEWGVGSYGDLDELGELLASHGGGFVGALPVLAPFLEPGHADPGPYLPGSKLAWNEAFVDVRSLPELGCEDSWASEARRLLAASAARRRAMPVPGREGRGAAAMRADVAAAVAAKRPVLELLARSLFEGGGRRRAELEAFVRDRPALAAFARFRAACDRLGPYWQKWIGGGAGRLPPAALDPETERYHLYVQWVADAQLRRAGRHGLYLDIPVGVHPWGFDTWLTPSLFVRGVSGGAPADDFFPGGQAWGFPPVHPERSRADGHRYLAAAMRHAMGPATMVRVDHVMGLHRQYFVPDGFAASDGVYVRYPAAETRAVVVLEAWRAKAAVVGEDLGTVPDEVRRALARDGMLSSFVFQFASRRDDPLPAAPSHSLASFGTHDLPTFASFWRGDDIERRHASGALDANGAARAGEQRAAWRRRLLEGLGLSPDTGPAAALRGVLVRLAAGPAASVLVDLEDLWLERCQQNHPGTGPEAGNFTRRAARTLAEIGADTELGSLFDRLTAARAGAATGTSAA